MSAANGDATGRLVGGALGQPVQQSLRQSLRQFGMYLCRLYWEQRTYKTAVGLGLLSSAIGLVQFVLLGRFLQQGGTFPGLEPYGGDVLGFLLSGSVFTAFVAVCLSSFSSFLQTEQQNGTLEAVLATPVSLGRLMAFATLTSLLGATAGSALMLLGFGAMFDVAFAVDIPGLLLVLTLLVMTLLGFGAAGCGVLLVAKRGDPVTWLVTMLTTLLSGVLYPVSVLPGWLQTVSGVLPTTAALDGLRRSMLTGAGVADVLPAAKVLAVWTVVALPLGVYMLGRGLRRAKQEGTLAEF